MRDEPARDAVAKAILAAHEAGHTFRTEAGFRGVLDAVLAALGIPPDTTVDDVRAGLAFLHMCRDSFHNEIVLTVNPDDEQDERPWWLASSHMWEQYGASPAAAVLALAAKIEEPGARG